LWNNVSKSNGGISGAFTSALVKPKASWYLNYLVGPENANTASGLRNLIDTTLLLTPPGKFNAYVNFDYGQNQDATYNCGEEETCGDNNLNKWYGVEGAFHEQASAKNAISGRFGWFDDANGAQTGTGGAANKLYEGTFTYEYKWVEGALMRVEYRIDKSNLQYFDKLADQFTDQQQTLTVAFIAFFGPHR
jgi:hypothetical protein